VTLRRHVGTLLRQRFGLELDDLTFARIDEIARRQAEAQRLELWLDALRDGDPSAVPMRAVLAAATNGQTYFMRDRTQLASLEAWLLGRHRELGRSLQIWSAGCSTGEEVYTLSILGLRLRVPLAVVGSDVNAESLERARRGVYSEWSLRHLAEPDRAAFFAACKDGFEVRSEVRRQTSFGLHNLASGALPPPQGAAGWDAILCRNVLIYFADTVRSKVIGEMESMLFEGGTLVLSSSESLRGAGTTLKWRQVGEGFLLIRQPPGEAGTSAPPYTRPRTSSVPPARASSAPPARPIPSSIPPERFPALARTDIRELLESGNRMLRGHAFHSALECYGRAIALDGLSFEPYLLQAIVQLKQGSLSDAKASLRSALFLEPQSWCAEYLAAGIHAREGQLADQVAALSRAQSALMRVELPLVFLSDVSGIEPLCYTRDQALSLCLARLRSLKKGI
jgi:chemotaxis protein methyltransferase CheR